MADVAKILGLDVVAGPIIVRKTADQIVNASTTLENDTHLLFPVGISEIWEFSILIRVTTSAVAGLKYDFAIPTNGALEWFGLDRVGGLTTWDLVATITATSWWRADDVASDKWQLCRGIYVGGDTAGNVQFQWAQLASEATDSKVLTNSYIIAHKLA